MCLNNDSRNYSGLFVLFFIFLFLDYLAPVSVFSQTNNQSNRSNRVNFPTVSVESGKAFLNEFSSICLKNMLVESSFCSLHRYQQFANAYLNESKLFSNRVNSMLPSFDYLHQYFDVLFSLTSDATLLKEQLNLLKQEIEGQGGLMDRIVQINKKINNVLESNNFNDVKKKLEENIYPEYMNLVSSFNNVKNLYRRMDINFQNLIRSYKDANIDSLSRIIERLNAIDDTLQRDYRFLLYLRERFEKHLAGNHSDNRLPLSIRQELIITVSGSSGFSRVSSAYSTFTEKKASLERPLQAVRELKVAIEQIKAFFDGYAFSRLETNFERLNSKWSILAQAYGLSLSNESNNN